jgi:two-component system chemotaxis response regulator CheB
VEFDAAHETAPAILARAFPDVALLVFGRSPPTRRIPETLAMLGQHAVEYLTLPDFPSEDAARDFIQQRILPVIEELVRTRARTMQIRSLENERRRGLDPSGALPRAANRDRSGLSGRFDICAIGISAGGPHALSRLLPLLPGRLNGSIVIAQHMPAGFTTHLAASLDQQSQLRVVEATDGMIVERGHVYVAPGGHHMIVRRRKDRLLLEILNSPPYHHYQPSADLLFRSLVSAIPTRTLAIVMTGMGDDGCEGLRELKEARAHTLAQSEGSCAVFGMPARVIEARLIDEVLDIEGLADRITAYLGVYNSAENRRPTRSQ